MRSRRILLAEDDPALRTLLASALARDGHRVVQAADGSELLERLGAASAAPGGEGYDLVISDVRMPGWSGLQMLAGLHGRRSAPPVILITAFGDETLHAEAGRLGALAVLDKPFDVDELRGLVGRALTGPGYTSP